MDTQAVEQELALPAVQHLLAHASLARLAYNGLDGRPRVVPIAFWWTGTEIVLSTAASSPKVKALAARPEVAITIDTGDTPESAKALSVRGTVDMRIVDGVTDEYLAESKRFLDPDKVDDFEVQVRAMYDQMARIAVRPDWVRFYDFGAGRFPKFLSDLVNRA